MKINLMNKEKRIYFGLFLTENKLICVSATFFVISEILFGFAKSEI